MSGKVIDKAERVQREAPYLFDLMFDGAKTIWDAERELNRIARETRRDANRQKVAAALREFSRA